MSTAKKLMKSPLVRAFIVAVVMALVGLSQLSHVHAATQPQKKSVQETEQDATIMSGTVNNPGPVKPKSTPPSQSPDDNKNQDEENGNMPPKPKKDHKN